MNAIGVDIVGFAVFACAMVGTPGPANMVLLAAGARFGLRPSLPFAAGVIKYLLLGAMPIGFGLMALQFLRFVFGPETLHTGQAGVHE